jgi:hypothetical protein
MKIFLLVHVLIPKILATKALASPASSVGRPLPTPTSTSINLTSTSLSTATISVNHIATTVEDALDPTITLGPNFDGDVSSWMKERWHLTTYWSCHTFDKTYVDCGW